jgi:hypothetical protein
MLIALKDGCPKLINENEADCTKDNVRIYWKFMEESEQMLENAADVSSKYFI